MKALLLLRKSHKTPASLRASAHAGVAPKGIPFGHSPPVERTA